MTDVQKRAARYISQGCPDLQRILRLPHNTVVKVNARCFKLLEDAYVTGTPADFAAAFENDAHKVARRRLSVAFDALNYQLPRERGRL